MNRIALLAMFFASPALAEVGSIVEANNSVVIRGDETLLAEEGLAVEQGDLLQTTPTGLIHVLLNDETKFVVGPGTAISIDTALIGDDESAFESLAVGMTAGVFRMITGNSESEAYEVNTPVSTLGVRGSAFEKIYYERQTPDGTPSNTLPVGVAEAVFTDGLGELCAIDDEGNRIPESCIEVPAAECTVAAAINRNEDGAGNQIVTEEAEDQNAARFAMLANQQNLGILEDFLLDTSICEELGKLEPEDSLDDPQSEEDDTGPDDTDQNEGNLRNQRNDGIEEGRIQNEGLLPFFAGRTSSDENQCTQADLNAAIEARLAELDALIEAAGDDAPLELIAAQARLLDLQNEVPSANIDGADCDAILASCESGNSPAGDCFSSAN